MRRRPASEGVRAPSRASSAGLSARPLQRLPVRLSWRPAAPRSLAAALLLLVGSLLLPSPAAADAGPWGWPLAGPREVARPFAPPATTYGSGHRGADLPAAAGAPVRAAGAGRVSYAGLLAGRGVVVVVHGTLRTTYEPVTAGVRVGQQVELGAVLGQLQPGHEGCPAAACLHWGLRRGEQYLDPVRLVERGPVRLLPVDAPAGDALTGPLPLRARPLPAPMTVVVRPPGSDAAPAPTPVPVAAPAEEGWALRAADTPVALTVLVLLLLGLVLLARPRPGPASPPQAAALAVTPDVVALDLDAPVAPVLELDAERLRRRSG